CYQSLLLFILDEQIDFQQLVSEQVALDLGLLGVSGMVFYDVPTGFDADHTMKKQADRVHDGKKVLASVISYSRIW
ncbi:hypothetical protein Tco_1518671, partial [Tanacetum coccineum]